MKKMTEEELKDVFRQAYRLNPSAAAKVAMSMTQDMVLVNVRDDLIEVLSKSPILNSEVKGRCVRCGRNTNFRNNLSEKHAEDCTYIKQIERENPLLANVIKILDQYKS